MKNVLFFLCGLGLSDAWATDNFEIVGVPNWVTPVEIPSSSNVSKYDVLSGAYNSLIDHQFNLVEGADFMHMVTDIVTSAGVKSASEISIAFDTAYEHLQFHYLKVWRDGKVIDRTKELTFEFLRNEEQLRSNTYTGKLTAFDILDDIRKGDRLEYAFTLVGDNPIFENNHFRLVFLEHENPVDRYSLRILHEKDKVYIKKCNACDTSSIKEFDLGSYHVVQITKENIAASDFEKSIPSWILPYEYFSISSFQDWKAVNEWAMRVFASENGSELESFLTDLKAKHATLDEQIDAAIDYVQDEIRYMSLLDGIGSIKPYAPDQVLKQRFGDCKDKSLLLATILRQIGVPTAYPALVNTTLVKGVSTMLPAGQIFDHCIVYFNHENQDYWIDPTRAQQGGKFRDVLIPDYGKALVIGPSFHDLKDMNIDDRTSSVEVKETFTFSAFDAPCTLTVTTTHYGLMADLMRSSLEYVSRKELAEQYRKNYGSVFPNIESIGHVQIKDDELLNVLSTTETYSVTHVWNELVDDQFNGWRFRYEPLHLYNYIGQSECETKSFPVQIPYPTAYFQTTLIHLPQALRVEDENIVFDNDAFKYLSTIHALNDTLVELNFAFNTKSDEIAPSSFKKVCNDMNEISRQISLILTYASPRINNEKFRQNLKQFKTPIVKSRIEKYPLNPY